LSAACLPAVKAAAADRAREIEQEGKLAEAIEAVAAAEDLDSAAQAYARGNNLGSSSIRLHETFMVRLLKFGLPKTAAYPARRLLGLDQHNALAWSVVGYVHARNGELAKAFDATVTAVRLAQDNPSVLGNAGQLVAWYEYDQSTAKLSAGAKYWLDQARAELVANQDFAATYDKLAAAYQAVAKYDREIAAAKGEVGRLESQLASANSEYKSIMRDIDSCSSRSNELTRELNRCYPTHDPMADHLESSCGQHAGELTGQIRQEEAAIEDLRRRADETMRANADQISAIQSELNAYQGKLGALQTERGLAAKRIAGLFRWDPPAVNGVVTPEVVLVVEDFAVRLPRPGVDPGDHEGMAAQRLRVARLYVSNNFREQAATILTEMLHAYGSTKAAEEGRLLLVAIQG